MTPQADNRAHTDKLTLELRRGTLVLAVLSQLPSSRYGYSLMRRLAERGLEVEQGTLYPLLRRLAEQGLLNSHWDVSGSRPRKYYELSEDGRSVLRELTAHWAELVQTVAGLLESSEGEPNDGPD